MYGIYVQSNLSVVSPSNELHTSYGYGGSFMNSFNVWYAILAQIANFVLVIWNNVHVACSLSWVLFRLISWLV